MTIQQAKEMDMVDYLSRIGYEPVKVSGKSYWYLSPLHDEKTASFKVNRGLNRWYDFAEGKGGNLVDFGIAHYKCSPRDFLERLGIDKIQAVKKINSNSNVTSQNSIENPLRIWSVQDITSYPLLKYIQTRRISSEIAALFLKEIHYEIAGKHYYALGFKNNAGGYELRNENFKGSSSPKDISYIENGAENLAVFEGFFDFLSYKQMYRKQEEPISNFLILNSTSFFEKSLPKMREHTHVSLFLDNDATGSKFTQMALSQDSLKFKDQRQLYAKHNDLNDWLINIGKAQKTQLRNKQ